MEAQAADRIARICSRVYEGNAGAVAAKRIVALVDAARPTITAPVSAGDGRPGAKFPLTEEDAVLITYGDQFTGTKAPLSHLGRFLEVEFAGYGSAVHILPFAPYSSDDGFSVIDYDLVDPGLGTWGDIEKIAKDFRLMVDLVLNHCSAQHRWFRGFLDWDEKYRDFFITVPAGTDVSTVVRPRALPLLTQFATKDGEKLVWTTFSEDQVDLNYANPEVLFEMLGVLLRYLSHGAQIVRLDAIAYLWKELGTPCIHHPKTHEIVKLIRLIMEEVAPWGVLITETNVPHDENVSYFGASTERGTDEAHMVYQFSLPPLVLDAFRRQECGHLNELLARLNRNGGAGTYFNFLASHDGVGVLPARGFLTDAELDELLRSVQERGGRISYKATESGPIPYEMNVNYFDAIAEQALPDVQRARKFLCAQAIMLAVKGVPGIYVHSFIGSGNWDAGVELTGQNRTINREKISYEIVAEALNEESSIRRQVTDGYRRLLRARAESAAFHPAAGQTCISTGDRIFGFYRMAIEGTERVLCLHSLSHDTVECTIDETEIGFAAGAIFRDLISGDHVFGFREGSHSVSFELEPHEVLWLSYQSEESP